MRTEAIAVPTCKAPAAARVSGFTLVELLITLAIVGMLAVITVPVAQVAVQRSHEQELRRALWEIRQGLDAYKRALEEGRIPRVAGASGYPPDLQTLVDGVPDQRDPQHRMQYFLRRIPRDPMNADMTQTPEQSWGLRSYASPASDPQPGDDVFDVYTRSAQTGLNGIPYRQW